jgi:hypothetical protein
MAREYFSDEPVSVKPKKSREYFDDVSVAEKPETKPVIGASAAEMIPTGGYSKAPKQTVMAGEPSYMEKASMYAAAVPATALAARGLQLATAGSKVAPYTSLLSEALTPKTGKALATTMTAAGLTALPAEFSRYQVERGGGSPMAQQLTELGVASSVGALGLVATKLGTTSVDLIKKAFGGSAKNFSDALKARASGLIEQQRNLTKEQLDITDRVLEQMGRKPQVAQQRVTERFPVPVSPTKAEQQIAPEKLAVREKLGARVSKAEAESKRAADMAKLAQDDVQRTQSALTTIEQQMASQPGMTADDIGRLLQNTTKTLQKDGLKARKDAAGYEAVFQAAGDKPTVNTAGIKESVEKLERQTRNPTLQNVLAEIKSQLATDKTQALSLRSTDSLKGYLDSVIAGKEMKYGKLDKEIVRTVQNIKNQLMMKAKTTHKDYGKAIDTFRQMSRPLDIVERNGALKKVIDEDPVSTAYRMTEAEVTGYIIRKANAGNPVFTRLLQVRPDLQDSARLYFTKDLFGKDVAPTAKSFETWLMSNERPLRQTGLYDEFNTLRNAQRSAQQSVDDAKGFAETLAKTAQTAEQRLGAEQKLAREASNRLQKALKTTETPESFAGRMERASAAPPQQAAFATRQQQQQDLINDLDDSAALINMTTDPAKVSTVVSASIKKLRNKDLISSKQFDDFMRDAELLKTQTDAQTRARRILVGVAVAVGLPSIGLRFFGAPSPYE